MNKYLQTAFLITFSSLSFAQVTITTDLDYRPDTVYVNGKDLLDIYMSAEITANVPVVVFLHGGALLNGDKSSCRELGMLLAENGIGMVSANYRLSPSFSHPAHVQDAAAATKWVFQNIEKYGGDANRVYVSGHSAGAYLAALLAIDDSFLGADIELAGSILISPFLYVEETAPDRIPLDPVYKTIWGEDPQSWLDASVSPHIGPGHNDILLIYADGDDDWRKEQNERFARTMTDAGNSNIKTIEVPNRNHGSLIGLIGAKDDRIVELILEFINN